MTKSKIILLASFVVSVFWVIWIYGQETKIPYCEAINPSYCDLNKHQQTVAITTLLPATIILAIGILLAWIFRKKNK